MNACTAFHAKNAEPAVIGRAAERTLARALDRVRESRPENGGRVRENQFSEGGVMNAGIFVGKRRGRKLALFTLVAALATAIVTTSGLFARAFRAPQARSSAEPADEAALLDGYRHVEVASVSDALEQLFGRRGYMSHRMRPIFTSRFAGFAVTVQLKKEEGTTDPNALAGMLAAIDGGGPNSVYVMSLEDGADIAGMGGLMGTAMAARNYSGAVIDGGVRDTAYLQKIGFPVFATGIVPSTSVQHYRFTGAGVP